MSVILTFLWWTSAIVAHRSVHVHETVLAQICQCSKNRMGKVPL